MQNRAHKRGVSSGLVGETQVTFEHAVFVSFSFLQPVLGHISFWTDLFVAAQNIHIE